MRIGIDARILPYSQKEGMAYYIFHLLSNLLEQDLINEYRFFYNFIHPENKSFILNLENIKNARNKVFYIPGRILDFFWTKAYFPPIDFFIGKLDLFHTLAITSSPPHLYMPPQIYGKKIITIHDVNPLKFQDEFKDIYNNSQYRRALNYVARKADAIICNSKSTQKDLIESTGISEDKTYVIYHGVGDDIYKVGDRDKISAILHKYHIKGKYILNVSRLDYNKNTINLIEAFYFFKKNYDFKLVLVGKIGNVADKVFAVIDKLGLSDSVIYPGYISREDLAALYSAAQLFVFPSICEGFGLPNLEAMKCEVPVISSDIASIKEITQDAALLIDPYDPQAISKAMARIIDDASLRESLIAKGRERVRLFTWEKTASQTLEVYRKTAGQA